jgi:hypothetical protein
VFDLQEVNSSAELQINGKAVCAAAFTRSPNAARVSKLEAVALAIAVAV